MIDLQKRTDAAMVSLVKAAHAAPGDLGEVSVQFVLAIDYSQSMEYPARRFYTNGDIQELTESLLALALTGLDADGEVQVYPFHHEALNPFTVTDKNYHGAVDRWRKPKFRPAPKMGGTNYLPVIKRIVDDLRSNGDLQPGKPPVLVVLQTDGESLHQDAIKQALVSDAKMPIFWVFLGLGPDTSFLEDLDTLPSRVVDNVGFTAFPQITGLDPEKLYDELLKEFLPSWLPKARSLGIVTS